MTRHSVFASAVATLLLSGAPGAAALERAPVAHWPMDTPDSVSGRFTVVEGVSGKAIRFDGFTTVITGKAVDTPRIAGAFSVDAWVALAAYPWNWCPILAQEKGNEKGYVFAVGPQGQIGLQLAKGGRWLTVESREKLPLRRWVHVAAVHDEDAGVTLFVDGVPAGELALRGPLAAADDVDPIIGSNRAKVPPSNPVPPALGTLPSWFSLDGILDEVRLFDTALGADEIARAARLPASAARPDIPPRVMPSGPAGPGRFGAYYTRLRYYDEWDALWPVADHPDVVVQFDGSPVRVVFWRGLRYSPAWVTENGLWLADQSGESGNHEGCVEHMQDIHTTYSHVRVVESSPARVVVHWRYAPVSAHGHLWAAEERTDWAWWVDEYYTFHPDGTGVRKVRWRRPEKGHEFPWLQIQETSVLGHPGQNAADVLRNDALTLLDIEGRSATYSWPDDGTVNTRERRNMRVDPSIVRDLQPAHPVIQVVNMRSAAKPFVMFEPGNRPLVYVGRVRNEVTNFPAYNHWPVSQVRSDGRFAQAADRATSFSISQNRPTRHAEEGGFEWVAMLYGATFDEPQALLPLARSWMRPPELRVRKGEVKYEGYDVGQRAYLLSCPGTSACDDLSLELRADAGSPLVNALLVLEGAGSGPFEVSVDGQRLQPGRGLRTGERQTLEGTDQILWLEKTSTVPVTVRISRHPRR
ncbi:MAG TPA: LamG domain-containing protein [Vicinamibacteria bacterium]|nr:LamG domain-containing protein [Vicinamibacteria bacterium]